RPVGVHRGRPDAARDCPEPSAETFRPRWPKSRGLVMPIDNYSQDEIDPVLKAVCQHWITKIEGAKRHKKEVFQEAAEECLSLRLLLSDKSTQRSPPLPFGAGARQIPRHADERGECQDRDR